MFCFSENFSFYFNLYLFNHVLLQIMLIFPVFLPFFRDKAVLTRQKEFVYFNLQSISGLDKERELGIFHFCL
jgi:hypothetical protein